YPVLAPVSRSYPRAKGRLPTCYSPVRHSPPPEEGDPFDLHVLSTPPAFVLSQDQTLQKRSFDNPAETVPTGVGTTAIQNINGTTDKNVDTLLSSQETDTLTGDRPLRASAGRLLPLLPPVGSTRFARRPPRGDSVNIRPRAPDRQIDVSRYCLRPGPCGSGVSARQFDSGERPAAAAKQQPAAVQQVAFDRLRLDVLDLGVVHVRAALLDRPARGRAAGDDARVGEQLEERRQAGDLRRGQLGQGRFQRALVERRQIAL